MASDETTPGLSLDEAAQLLQVSERTIARWVENLGMPSVRHGGDLRFDRGAVIAWADEHSFKLAAAVPGEPAAALPELAPAIEAGGIHDDVPGSTVEQALDEVAHRLQLPDLVDRDFFHQVLLAREDLGSTGIGEGVAIPHVRAPLVLHIEHPVVGLFFLEEPVDWSAIDVQPVDTLFVVVSPSVRPHLHLLSRIAYVLRDASFRRLLHERTRADKLLARLSALDEAIRPEP